LTGSLGLINPTENLGRHNGALDYQGAFSRNFSFTFGTSAITKPFRETFLSLWDFGYHGTSLWDLGYHVAFSLNFSFSLGSRLSQSFFMESFFLFGISAIMKPFHETFLSLWDPGYHRAFS
jgi:hypothetical protein